MQIVELEGIFFILDTFCEKFFVYTWFVCFFVIVCVFAEYIFQIDCTVKMNYHQNLNYFYLYKNNRNKGQESMNYQHLTH